MEQGTFQIMNNYLYWFVGLIHGEFIELVRVFCTTVDSLTTAIKDVLIHCILPLSNYRGQAYDGTSNMKGCLNGRATQILTSKPT